MSSSKVAEPNVEPSSRDRFIGFAFAGAHLLLETDCEGRVTFAAGARCGLVEGSTEKLVGRSLYDLAPREEHSLLRLLFQRLLREQKLDPSFVVLQAANAEKFGAQMGGCRLPTCPDRCFFSVLFTGNRRSSRAAGRCNADLSSFVRELEGRIVTAQMSGRQQNLSLLMIDGLRTLLPIGGDDPWQDLRLALEAYLLALSSDADGALRLADERYAVLHDDTISTDEIRTDIGRLLTDHGATDLESMLHLKQIPVDCNELPSADVARAIAYTLRRFAEEGESDGFSITSVGSGMQEMLHTTVERITEARRVLEERQFRLVFQPIVALATGQIHHVEALMRIGSSASPAEFIAFMERIGMMGELDLLVFQAALDALCAAEKEGRTVPAIAVNLSAASLSSQLVLRQLETLLHPHGSRIRKLLIEVTETAVVTDFTQLNETLQYLRGLGMPVCLDDVGAGSTSFMSLNALKVDYVKLDGAIVRGAMKEGRDRAIVQSILEICRHMDTNVVAEQIETEAERQVMRQLAVRYGQGYLFGKPDSRLPDLFPPETRPRPPVRRKGTTETWQ